MTKSDRIIDQLFTLARDHDRVANARIVAAVVHNGRIISYGFNQKRTAKLQQRFKRNAHSHYLHAEVDAIRNALRVIDADKLKSASLYVVRAKKSGQNGHDIFGLAKPCSGCQNCIDFFGLKSTYYTTNGDRYAEAG